VVSDVTRHGAAGRAAGVETTERPRPALRAARRAPAALLCAALAAAGAPLAARAAAAQPWRPDLGDGRYRNPIVFADYSDPDVIRVGDDFYMTASSFGAVPALPILHSRDLVHWTIVNHAVRRLPPEFDRPQHGNGVWAPSIREHAGEFFIYWGDPDRGIYMVKTRDPRGAWEPPVLVKAAKGWIDPTPLWDDDGRAYLVHAFANSRAGIKSVLHVTRMSPDGRRLLDEGTLVFDGRARHPTIEGPKFHKRGGWYYIFAPAGGVPTGWQTVLRARTPLGPYEDRVVLAQGTTPVNGPHQGAWVELRDGAHWFVHFQDRGAYGRILHLQPMRWRDGWPVIGADPDGDGTGEPVLAHAKPAVARAAARGAAVPQTSDEFTARTLGLQWQWHANPQRGWASLTARPGHLRLATQPLPADAANLWGAPHLLLQKLPAPAFTATTRLALRDTTAGATAGLLLMGLDYAYVAVRRTPRGYAVVQARALQANEGAAETAVDAGVALPDGAAHLRVTVRGDTLGGAESPVLAQFSYSRDGVAFTGLGAPFRVREGRWVGAKVGLFARRDAAAPAGGSADVDHFRVR
jgi:beta-xylosidase